MPVYTSIPQRAHAAFLECLAGLCKAVRDIAMYVRYITPTKPFIQKARNTANHWCASVQCGVCAKPASRNRRSKPSTVYL